MSVSLVLVLAGCGPLQHIFLHIFRQGHPALALSAPVNHLMEIIKDESSVCFAKSADSALGLYVGAIVAERVSE